MLRLLPLLMLCSATTLAHDSDVLFAAIRRNDPAAVEALLHQHANPNARNSDGATPRMYAAIHAGRALMRLLVARGADPNSQNPAGATGKPRR